MQTVGATTEPLLQVIHEDTHLLVLNKPADLVCHPTKAGPLSSLIGRVRTYLATQPDLSFHLINRLDRETSGVVLVAKSNQVAAELARIWENRLVTKEYLAIVHGEVKADSGHIEAPLGKDTGSVVAIKDCVRQDGAPAGTDYSVEGRFVKEGKPFSLLQCRPLTGRKHQLRIHLAHLGHPIVGDKIYGGDEGLYLRFITGELTLEDRERLMLPCHALHAQTLRFAWRGEQWEFHAQPELRFTQFAAGDCSQA